MSLSKADKSLTRDYSITCGSHPGRIWPVASGIQTNASLCQNANTDFWKKKSE